ncbi:MAG: hypothetical protein JSR98_16655 [Proteobacteria bacterium]|nr:hypothetical protein [Pseudomonadota bacterium]
MWSRLLILAFAAILAAPLGARAGEDKDKKSKEVGQYVDLQPVAMPIVVDGRLVNYVFVYVRVNLKPNADVIKIRDKEPLFRDALVRDAHKTPFVLPNDWQKVDEAKLVAAMTRDASAIVPGAVASVSITSQTSQKRVMPPRPATPDTP